MTNLDYMLPIVKPEAPKKITGIIIIIVFVLSCASTPPEIETETVTTTFRAGLKNISFCSSQKCNDPETVLQLSIYDDHLLLFLDLRNSGDLKLISRIKNKSIINPRISLISTGGETVAVSDLNYHAHEYKEVTENYAKRIQVNPERQGAFIIRQPEKKKEFSSDVRLIEYADTDIIPQVIPLDDNAAKGRYFILLSFELNFQDVLLDESDERKIIQTARGAYSDINSFPVPVNIKFNSR